MTRENSNPPGLKTSPLPENDLDVMTIGPVARVVGVCPDTIRIWEKKGLIKPRREGTVRVYDRCDIERLKVIHMLIRFEKINIAGVRSLLRVPRWWETPPYSEKIKKEDAVFLNTVQK